MDESHFEDTGARVFRYSFFAFLSLVTFVGIWKKNEILNYFSFREHGESRIVIYGLSGTSVNILDEKRNKRELGLIGRDGKFTLVEQGGIASTLVYLNHPYYFPEEKLFERVPKGETIHYTAQMKPMFGSLSVRSFPQGATIRVNEEEVGEAPYKRKDIRDGTRLYIEAFLDGYIPQFRDVEVRGGRVEEVVFSLASTECSILLETSKPGFAFDTLSIFIDEVPVSLDGQRVRYIPPGLHDLQVIAHDGLKLQKSFNIKPGQTIRLQLPDWFVDDGS